MGRGLPIFRHNKVFSVEWSAEVSLKVQGGLTRGVVPDLERRHQEHVRELKNLRKQRRKAFEELRIERRRNLSQRRKLQEQKSEVSQLNTSAKP
jgi:hypothetical protein